MTSASRPSIDYVGIAAASIGAANPNGILPLKVVAEGISQVTDTYARVTTIIGTVKSIAPDDVDTLKNPV